MSPFRKKKEEDEVSESLHRERNEPSQDAVPPQVQVPPPDTKDNGPFQHPELQADFDKITPTGPTVHEDDRSISRDVRSKREPQKDPHVHKCSNCDGTGLVRNSPADGLTTCPVCDGAGQRKY